jgi:hypothetical protein
MVERWIPAWRSTPKGLEHPGRRADRRRSPGPAWTACAAGGTRAPRRTSACASRSTGMGHLHAHNGVPWAQRASGSLPYTPPAWGSRIRVAAGALLLVFAAQAVAACCPVRDWTRSRTFLPGTRTEDGRVALNRQHPPWSAPVRAPSAGAPSPRGFLDPNLLETRIRVDLRVGLPLPERRDRLRFWGPARGRAGNAAGPLCVPLGRRSLRPRGGPSRPRLLRPSARASWPTPTSSPWTGSWRASPPWPSINCGGAKASPRASRWARRWRQVLGAGVRPRGGGPGLPGTGPGPPSGLAPPVRGGPSSTSPTCSPGSRLLRQGGGSAAPGPPARVPALHAGGVQGRFWSYFAGGTPGEDAPSHAPRHRHAAVLAVRGAWRGLQDEAFLLLPAALVFAVADRLCRRSRGPLRVPVLVSCWSSRAGWGPVRSGGSALPPPPPLGWLAWGNAAHRPRPLAYLTSWRAGRPTAGRCWTIRTSTRGQDTQAPQAWMDATGGGDLPPLHGEASPEYHGIATRRPSEEFRGAPRPGWYAVSVQA